MIGYSVISMRLPCGCKLGGEGQRFCPEAVRLWNVSIQAKLEARGAQTEFYWLKYEMTKRDYEKHFLTDSAA